MFIYQTKINQKDALVTVSDTMDDGRQLPITNGTVSALYEDNGTLTFGEVEISEGGEQDGPYFYSVTESGQFEKMDTPYNLPEADFIGSESNYWHLGFPYDEHNSTPVCVKKNTICTCKSSTGYDLSVTLEDIPIDSNYKEVCVGISDTPDDFYDKTVEYNKKNIPAVDITVSTGGAIFTCTIAPIPTM